MKGGQPSGIVSARLLTSEHWIRYIIQRKTQKKRNAFLRYFISVRSFRRFFLFFLALSLSLCLLISSHSFALFCVFFCFLHFSLFYFDLVCLLVDHRAAEWPNTLSKRIQCIFEWQWKSEMKKRKMCLFFHNLLSFARPFLYIWFFVVVVSVAHQWIKQQDNGDIPHPKKIQQQQQQNQQFCDKSNNNNNKIDQNGITAEE